MNATGPNVGAIVRLNDPSMIRLTRSVRAGSIDIAPGGICPIHGKEIEMLLTDLNRIAKPFCPRIEIGICEVGSAQFGEYVTIGQPKRSTLLRMPVKGDSPVAK